MSFNNSIICPLGVSNSSSSVVNSGNSSAKPNLKLNFYTAVLYFISTGRYCKTKSQHPLPNCIHSTLQGAQECCTAYTRQMSGNGWTFSDSSALFQISSDHQYRLDFTFGHLEYSLFCGTFWRPVFPVKHFADILAIRVCLKRQSIIRGTEDFPLEEKGRLQR